jgi:hypothetical protein
MQNIESKVSEMCCSIKKVEAKMDLFTATMLDVEGFCDMTPGRLANSD